VINYNYKMKQSEQFFTRNLATTLCSKIGGNVDHNLDSAIEEFIDNSIDAKANEFIIHILEDNYDKNNICLLFLDNGTGINNINNIFNGKIGKKNKIGCKNNGFMDSLVYLTNLNCECFILTKCKDKHEQFISIDYKPLVKEYENQKKKKSNDNIDYGLIQSKLTDNCEIFDSKRASKALITQPEYTYFKNYISKFETYTGFILTIPKKNNIINFDDFDVKSLNYKYNYKLNIKYINEITDTNAEEVLDKHIKILGNDLSNRIIFKVYSNDKDNSIISIMNNFNTNSIYLEKHKPNQYSSYKYTKREYANCKFNNLLFECHINDLSDLVAEEQKDILNRKNKEDLRFPCFVIQNNIKVIYTSKFPNTDKGWYIRNLKELRFMFNIYDDTLIEQSKMINKHKFNIDKIDVLIKTFFKVLYPYKQIIKKDDTTNLVEFSKQKWPNILKYLEGILNSTDTDDDNKPGPIDPSPIPKPVPNPKPVVKSSIKLSTKENCWSRWKGSDKFSYCPCCRKKLWLQKREEVHYGHIQPESKGGETTWKNLLPVCKSCNLNMGTKHMKKYIQDKYPSNLSLFINKLEDYLNESNPYGIDESNIY